MTKKRAETGPEGAATAKAGADTLQKRVTPAFYGLSLFVFIVTVGVSVLPLWVEGASVIYDDAFLPIMYGLLALSVSLFLFGVIGDSQAMVKLPPVAGIGITLVGSAAGFGAFYYLLSSGLNPYRTLTIYLYDESEKLLTPAAGPIELTIASQERRTLMTSNGSATFAHLPRSEEAPLVISGGGWERKEAKPSECWSGTTVRRRCKRVDIVLRRQPLCLRDLRALVNDHTPISPSLERLLESFRIDMQSHGDGVSVAIRFSDGLVKKGLDRKTFMLQRRNEVQQTGREILADIARWYNRAFPASKISIYATCTRVYVASAGEAAPSAEYEPCE